MLQIASKSLDKSFPGIEANKQIKNKELGGDIGADVAGISGNNKNPLNINKSKNFAKLKKLNLAKAQNLHFAKANSFKTDFFNCKARKTFIYFQKTFTLALIFYFFEPKRYTA